MIAGQVVAASAGLRGFDANSVITPADAKRFFDAGYRFAVRYVRRSTPHNFDLSTQEANAILSSGLGLMVVQHVAPDGWTPTRRDGQLYGAVAAGEAKRIGIPAGVMLWCDLEGVSTSASSDQVIDFCNQWHSQVLAAGFVPGLYVGWHPGLDARQLYFSLQFCHYWGAYNVDVVPAARGFQMKQSVMRECDAVQGVGFGCDVNTVMVDALGGLPTLLTRAAT